HHSGHHRQLGSRGTRYRGAVGRVSCDRSLGRSHPLHCLPELLSTCFFWMIDRLLSIADQTPPSIPPALLSSRPFGFSVLSVPLDRHINAGARTAGRLYR